MLERKVNPYALIPLSIGCLSIEGHHLIELSRIFVHTSEAVHRCIERRPIGRTGRPVRIYLQLDVWTLDSPVTQASHTKSSMAATTGQRFFRWSLNTASILRRTRICSQRGSGKIHHSVSPVAKQSLPAVPGPCFCLIHDLRDDWHSAILANFPTTLPPPAS
jgi:hypothetical protein